ncbi:MAG TPA: efflux RND transporter periplasmic adaptor subunit [Candidatus Krumholzibacteria bacterium]
MKSHTCHAIRVAGALLLLLPACQKKETAPLYEEATAERRTIVVSASATGAIEPVRAFDVKSKASGEIIEMPVETGDEVRAGQLLATIDPRTPQNTLSQARADLDVAQAQLKNSTLKLGRADTLRASQAITEEAFEDARLAHVEAQAQVVRATAALETARDQMNDTKVRAATAGTLIAKNVELGTVISSPTRDVGGGTVLMRMANLDTVQIRTLVDETDIGKVRPGMEAVITVDAYPNRPFTGLVLKIEPQATVVQNVTMFPALVRIANPGHLLMPGMNAEVEIQIGTRENVVTIPYAALRTPRDVASAATVLGLDPEDVQAQLKTAAAAPAGAGAPADTARAKADTSRTKATAGAKPGGGRAWAGGANGPGGGGGDGAAMQQRAMGGGGAGAGGGQSPGGGAGMRGGMGGGRGSMGGRYIVFTLRDGKPTPVPIKTGLTDLDYVEVLDGLNEGDKVIVLPSASLVNSQREMRERMTRMTGGGGIPGMRQQQQQPTGGTPPPQR